VAYEAIVRRLQVWHPEMSPLPRDAFAATVATRFGGDLALNLGVADVRREETTTLALQRPPAARQVAFLTGRQPLHWAQLWMETPQRHLPKALVLHDSFINPLAPWLAEHFGRIGYVRGYELDQALVERERPAVLIEERVERSLMQPP
jgi:hypothetical protein